MVGVKLALAGEDVTFIIRGANLEAARKSGIRLIMEDGTRASDLPVKATDRLAEAGPQDVVDPGDEGPPVAAGCRRDSLSVRARHASS